MWTPTATAWNSRKFCSRNTEEVLYQKCQQEGVAKCLSCRFFYFLTIWVNLREGIWEIISLQQVTSTFWQAENVMWIFLLEIHMEFVSKCYHHNACCFTTVLCAFFRTFFFFALLYQCCEKTKSQIYICLLFTHLL